MDNYRTKLGCFAVVSLVTVTQAEIAMLISKISRQQPNSLYHLYLD